ncbi:hypothetical protein [Aneurinibacillus tyrosinisolvens]|uniref:hypothetical protein n=1 Tax=Aneurinibacillus tyrosinisolvens TaxID=1443435 RepID=UPI00063F21FA|nr:hypothetical protein [Aneurinibacillus tyrosinisolvens]
MKVTHTFKIPYEQALYGQLRSKQVECGKVWTDIIRYANQYYRTCKKWMSTSDLESMMKNTYDLPSQTVQALIAKYDANRKTTLELRKKGNTKAKYPWRFKYFFSIPYKQAAFEVHKDRIILKHSNFSAPLSLVTMMGKKKKRLE